MNQDRKDDPHLMFDRNFNPKINDKNLQPGTYVLHPDGSLTPTTVTASKPLKRLRRDPLEGHPRAAETRQAMREARIDDEQEVAELQASELACELADKWASDRMACRLGYVFDKHPELARGLDRLELVTRPSGMRKVRP